MISRGHKNGGDGPGRFEWVLAVTAGLVGLLMAHFPMIVSGLRLVQTDRGDTRLINYLLEHNDRWYRGDPNHAGLWDPPFFYPARNVAAYSDTFFGIAPVYAAFRVAGLPPDTSFQLWMLALSALNYAVMLHLLRRRLGLSVAAAAAGAFLFAFGAARVNRLATPQHLTQCLSLVAVDALFGIFQGVALPAWRRGLLWLVATAGVVAQLTSSFYLGWFLVLSMGIASLVAVRLPSTRGPFLAVLRRDAPWVAVPAVAGGLVLRAWAARHLSAEFGTRYLPYVWGLIPRPAAWLNMGPWSWFESWTTKFTSFTFPLTEVELRLGLGLVTTLACLAGLVRARDRPPVRLLAVVAAALFLILTMLPPVLVTVTAYGLVLGALAFAFAGRHDRPWVFALVVGIVLVSLCVNGMARGPVLGCGLFALVLTAAAFVGWSGDRRGRLVLGGLGLGLLVTLIPAPPVLAWGAVFGGGLAAVAAVLGWRSRARVEAVALGGLLLSAALITYAESPAVLRVAALGLLAVAAARAVPSSIRPPARALPEALIVGLVTIRVFGPDGTAWLFFYQHVPGASSLLFVARVGLMMLIPAAIGLGFAIDALRAKGRTWLALALAAVCLAEQGVWTRSFDKYENRRTVSEVARAVDARAEAFYYSPSGSPTPSFQASLDAMWAGLECGKPTVNGYSGGAPIGWRALEGCVINEPRDELRLLWALRQWRRRYGRSVGRVTWVIGRVGLDLDAVLESEFDEVK
jgi:hypothetical protein